jgi:hypothetical protein
MKHIAYRRVIVALFAILLASLAAGQSTPTSAPPSDSSSLADYARKVRKDPGGAKAKPKVFDNDNLPVNDKISVIGQKPAEDAAPAPAPAADDKDKDKDKDKSKDAAATKPTDEEQAKKQAANNAWKDKLSAQKDQIDLASRELDVTQREYQLRAAAMYADAGNRMRNEGQWDKQDADYKQKIADKQKALDDAKQKLTGMQEEARKAGVPAAMIE